MSNHRVLIFDNESAHRASIRDYLEGKGYRVQEAATGTDCLRSCRADLPHAVLMDCFFPGTEGLHLLHQVRKINASIPIIVITAHASVELAVRAIKEGADQLIIKPAQPSAIHKLLENVSAGDSQKSTAPVGFANHLSLDSYPFIGNSDGMKHLQESAHRIVGMDYPILITGETGVGKGVLARWLHRNGKRSKQPLVNLNCAGLHRELLESDLFGHEKGSFTGAVVAKPGIMEVAHQGTIFLDEIGDMDLAIQPKLLKALDEKKFRRVGGIVDRSVDVHLISATHRDLAFLLGQEKFRDDLYFRISTIPLRVPPLRERIADIALLAERFRQRLQNELGLGDLHFGSGAMEAMQAYSWPGNIRELRSVIERAALLCKDGEIRVPDLNLHSTARSSAAFAPHDADLTVEEIVRRHIALVLHREEGNVDRASLKLGVSRSSLYSKIKQYGLR